jgi:hypothetical protein
MERQRQVSIKTDTFSVYTWRGARGCGMQGAPSATFVFKAKARLRRVETPQKSAAVSV